MTIVYGKQTAEPVTIDEKTLRRVVYLANSTTDRGVTEQAALLVTVDQLGLDSSATALSWLQVNGRQVTAADHRQAETFADEMAQLTERNP